MLSHIDAEDGTRLAYRDDGEGPALLALPGLTRNGRDFDFVAPHLEGLRLVRPDYRGRGASGHADWSTYTVPQEAADVLRLMDHLGIEAAAFLGTSRGGLISMALAAMAPDRVRGVCLNDVGPVVERAGLEAIGDYIGKPPAGRTLDDAAEARARGAAAAGFEGVPLARWREDAERSLIEGEDGLSLAYDADLRQSFLAAMDAPLPDLWPLFATLAGKPVCVIRGGASKILTEATMDRMDEAHPGLIRATVPGRGHPPFLDEPAALAAIRRWLEALA